MEFNKVKLGEIADFFNGGAWSDKEYVASGLPVLKVTNCKNSGFEINDISYLPFESAIKYATNRLHLKDVIIATVGSHPNLVNSSAGRSIVVNSLVEGFYLNQNAVCVRTKNNNILDQSFLGYHCKLKEFQNYIQMRGKGAANQMRIAISTIKGYPISLPPLPVQRRIASILSNYDDLIENYQRQIKLLEESAQRIYKEWFVDFRFPGHENAKFIDGLPEGWGKKKLGEIADFKRGKNLLTKEAKEGNIPVVAGGLTPSCYHNEANTQAPVITVSGSGANAGYTALYYNDVWASDCSYCDITKTDYIFFVFGFLDFNKELVKRLQCGSAQPHVYAKDINNLDCFHPNETILNKFISLVNPMHTQISNFSIQIRNLREARNVLLPKLMNGEIGVE